MSRFMRSLSAEFRKATATKTWWVLAIVLALYSAMMAATFAFIFGAMFEQMGEGAPQMPAQEAANMVYSTMATFGYVIPLLLGGLTVTGEMRHRTLGLAFTAEPKRGIVLVSKAVSLLVLGVVIAVIGLIGTVGVGAGTLIATGGDAMLDSTETWLLFGRMIVVIALWTVLGFGVGLLVGNQAMAIVIALVFTQFLEPVLRVAAAFWDWTASIARFLPGSSTDAFVGASVLTDLSMTDPTMPAGIAPLSNGQGLLVLVAYGVVLVVLGWLTRWRRDVE